MATRTAITAAAITIALATSITPAAADSTGIIAIPTSARLEPASRAQIQASLVRAANRAAIQDASRIPAQWQDFADCVATRESHHNPKALNKGSGAAGKWQFMPAWRRGLPHMVAERLASHGATPRLVRRLLASAKGLPINKWKEHYQDIGFVAVITSTEGMGWKHWYLAGSRCNRLVPARKGA